MRRRELMRHGRLLFRFRFCRPLLTAARQPPLRVPGLDPRAARVRSNCLLGTARRTALSASDSLFVASSGSSNGILPDDLSQLDDNCKVSRKLCNSFRAASEATGGPAEKAAHTVASVIQTG